MLQVYPRFAMLGFDVAFYFLKGISQYGPAFDDHLGDIGTTPYQSGFDFQRVSNWGGFINKKVLFIRFRDNDTTEMIEFN